MIFFIIGRIKDIPSFHGNCHQCFCGRMTLFSGNCSQCNLRKKESKKFGETCGEDQNRSENPKDPGFE